MRRTKIVCTLGPATMSVDMLKKLIANGMDVARINFSHGTYASHKQTIELLKEAREAMNAPIPLMLDTKGPEIRIKNFSTESVILENGKPFTLTTEEVEGDETKVSITYAELPKDVTKGTTILIDDGLIELEVTGTTEKEIFCKIVNGGVVSANKGVNVPGVYINLPSLTEKDVADLKFGVENGFDLVAASFIRSAADVAKLRHVLEEFGGEKMLIISKIENREGVNNIDEILEVSDGIMVARGDLGVEIPPEEVPLVQKTLIRKANALNKHVITATQMLESMISNPRPTRAEANDVANAIFDGTDCVMLSGETAKGDYPAEAVATMARIAEKTESSIDYTEMLTKTFSKVKTSITNALSYAACTAAAELGTTCICTVTRSGFTARMVAKHRPICPIVAGTGDEQVWRQLNLLWNCKPVLYQKETPTSEMFHAAVEVAKQSGLVREGDTIVTVVGMPAGTSGATNTMRVDIVGNILCKGIGIGHKRISGKSCIIRTRKDLETKFRKGDILVTTATDNDYMPYIQKASALIVGPVGNGDTCHAEIAARALNLPVILCNTKVVDFLPDRTLLTLDPQSGSVFRGIPENE